MAKSQCKQHFLVPFHSVRKGRGCVGFPQTHFLQGFSGEAVEGSGKHGVISLVFLVAQNTINPQNWV